MAMTPHGLRRLAEADRLELERERRVELGRLRHDLAAAALELKRSIGPLTAPGPRGMSDAEVNAAATATGAAATRLAEAALELAIATEHAQRRR